MWTFDCLCLLTFVAVVLSGENYQLMQEESNNCSAITWSVYNKQTGDCECGSPVRRIVFCTKHGKDINVNVLDNFCITRNSKMTENIVGPCLFRPFKAKSSNVPLSYTPLTNNSFELDENMCGNARRTGQMCGRCINGTSPPVYSYRMECVRCPSGTTNWGKYLAISLLPLTVFYIAVIALGFRATAPYLNGYILFSQLATSPLILRRIHHYSWAGQIAVAVFSFWNLDFFKGVYHPFCLHSSISTLQALSLDYIIAVYPLILIILTYALVRLHFYNFRLIVWLSRPLIRCFACIRRQWDIQSTLVDAFATFFLLSYVKFASASLDILMPCPIWNTSATLQWPVVYYDGTMEYLGREHLPYAILAISALLVFTLFPVLLLCLYPCRRFQRLLNKCHLQRQLLNTFVDAFQGSFKNGTNGTGDYRYFAAVFLITRVLAYMLIGVSMTLLSNSGLLALLMGVVIILVLFSPYTNSLYTKIDIVFLTVLAVLASCAWSVTDSNSVLREFADTLGYIVAPIPLLYPVFPLLYTIYKRSSLLQTIHSRLVSFCTHFHSSRMFQGLPYRVTMIESTNLMRN